MRRRFIKKGLQVANKGNKEQSTSSKLDSNVNTNIQQLQQLLDTPNDLVIREMKLGREANIISAIVYIDGLIDKQIVQQSIIKNLNDFSTDQKLSEKNKELFNDIYQSFTSIHSLEKGHTLEDVANGILSGKTVLFIDGQETVLIIDTKGGESRSIDQPVSETVVRGPRAAFVENIGTNLSLLRRSLQTPDLRFKNYQIGKRSKRSLVVAYVEGIVNPSIVKEVNRRLEAIDIDDAPDSGFIEQWIEDSFLSPFPQMENTERADKAGSALLEGKVVILLDGSPFALLAPFTLGDFLKSPEDYYERWIVGSLLRTLRYFAAVIAMILPGLYISLVSLHSGLLPTDLALSIASSRDGVPFPPAVEAFMMIITMELLQEAGIRLPTPIGQTIGIVGGLVIGDAAVSAGIVSPIMVIVVGLTAIAAFANPSFSMGISFRILRVGFMIAAAIFGLYGIILIFIIIMIHMVNLKCFGVPFSTPFAPTMLRDWKDLVLRAPMSLLTKRPKFMDTEDKKSADKGVKN